MAQNKKRPTLHDASVSAMKALAKHPLLTGLGAGFFIVFAGVLVFWYEVFSGYAEPIQFIYAAF